MCCIDRDTWLQRREAHRAAILPFTDGVRLRRGRGQLHPVHDFLFTYYAYPIAKLERWHPGVGYTLVDAGAEAVARAQFLDGPWYVRTRDGVTLDADRAREAFRKRAPQVRALCEAVESRAPRFQCFGLHEWAMVYRTDDPRHTLPLRLAQDDLNAFVESQTIACSHFDAYRFFTTKARPLNVLQPQSDRRTDFEQGGCIHVNMDLYKWAAKLSPLVPGELVRDCFLLAVAAREVDMRASPYDVRGLGLEPIAVETAAGRAEYVVEQARIADAARRLRRQLLDELARVEAVCEAVCGGAST